MSRSRTTAPGSTRRASQRLFALVALGLVLTAAALMVASRQRVRRLVAQLNADEDDLFAPRTALAAGLGPRARSFFTDMLDSPTDGARLAADYLLDQPGDDGLRRVAPLMADNYSQVRLRIVEAAARGRGPDAQRLLWPRRLMRTSGSASSPWPLWRARPSTGPTGLRRRWPRRRAVDDPDPVVVSTAMNAMRGLAGHDFGYRSRSFDRERAAAARRWRIWWEREAPVESPLPPPAAITRACSDAGAVTVVRRALATSSCVSASSAATAEQWEQLSTWRRSASSSRGSNSPARYNRSRS